MTLAYHILRNALAVHGRPPADLDATETEAVEARAGRTREIEDLVLSSPEAASVVLGDDAVEKALDEVRGRFETRGAFDQAMSGASLDEAGLRDALRRELLSDAVIAKVRTRAPRPSEAEVAGFFADNLDKFDRPETRTARHILITVNPDFAENTREAARARIDAIAARVTLATFEAEARSGSECPSALEGGRLGTFPRGRLYPQLDAVLFELAPGAVGGPVETEAGWHLVLCEAVEAPERATLQDAWQKIESHLAERAARATLRTWLDGLRKNHP